MEEANRKWSSFVVIFSFSWIGHCERGGFFVSFLGKWWKGRENKTVCYFLFCALVDLKAEIWFGNQESGGKGENETFIYFHVCVVWLVRKWKFSFDCKEIKGMKSQWNYYLVAHPLISVISNHKNGNCKSHFHCGVNSIIHSNFLIPTSQTWPKTSTGRCLVRHFFCGPDDGDIEALRRIQFFLLERELRTP